jgi:hypothetical protein
LRGGPLQRRIPDALPIPSLLLLHLPQECGRWWVRHQPRSRVRHRAGARHAWAQAGLEGPAPEWPLEVNEEGVKALAGSGASFIPEILNRIERELATNALTLWEGFAGFCEEHMGLEAEKVLKVVLEPGVERVKNLKALTDRLGLEPEMETAAEVREGLAEAWSIAAKAG